MCTPKEQEINIAKTDAVNIGEKNKELVKNVFDELITKRNTSAIQNLYAPTIVDHSAFEGQAQGIEGFKKAVEDFIGMFPDLHVNIEEMIASGDIVATRETWKGTHVTSKQVVTGETMHFFKIVDGKVTDEWSKGWEWLESVMKTNN